MTFRQKVKQTEAYKSLSKMAQMIVRNRNNIKYLEHGYNVATYQGYKTWEQISNFSYRNRAIIKEMVL